MAASRTCAGRRVPPHWAHCDRFPFRQPAARRARPDQHRQDPPRDRAAVRPLERRDRLPPAAAGARGLRPRAGDQRGRPSRAHHRRGADRAAECALFPVHRRGDAARWRRPRVRRPRRGATRRRPRARAYLHGPAPARPRPRGNHAARFGNAPTGGQGIAQGYRGRAAPAILYAQPCRDQETEPAAPALGGRRVLGRAGLRSG